MRDFGQVELFEAEAIGEPGNRTFRLRLLSEGEAASLWLEKEQLAALTVAIRQLLEQTEEGDASPEAGAPSGGTFPDQPQVDFKIGRLGMGYDEAQRMVRIFAYEPDQDENATPSFSCNATRDQCRAFADGADELIRAGRPICILCDGPIYPGGHNCPRSNGHAVHPISLE
ncbi:MAG: DUF3090 family protein [Candidatus Marinimicrobia bacterium]|nr:DUF3090 family protein [Candidatus Neomarinimicrobiota bacterium]